MIPLRDSIRPRRFPVVNVSLIAVNVLVFAYELALGPKAQDFIQTYGVIPERLMNPSFNFGFLPFLTLVTSIFLHGGLLHIDYDAATRRYDLKPSPVKCICSDSPLPRPRKVRMLSGFDTGAARLASRSGTKRAPVRRPRSGANARGASAV